MTKKKKKTATKEKVAKKKEKKEQPTLLLDELLSAPPADPPSPPSPPSLSTHDLDRMRGRRGEEDPRPPPRNEGSRSRSRMAEDPRRFGETARPSKEPRALEDTRMLDDFRGGGRERRQDDDDDYHGGVRRDYRMEKEDYGRSEAFREMPKDRWDMVVFFL